MYPFYISSSLDGLRLLPIEFTINGVTLKYDINTGNGWSCDKNQEKQLERIEVKKRLDEAKRQLAAKQVDLQAGALVVAEIEVKLQDKIQLVEELRAKEVQA